METFIPLLVNLLGNPGHGDETTGQVMLLACRCLYNVVDILPPTARIIVGHGGLSVLCANLLNIEYIDVAELTALMLQAVTPAQVFEQHVKPVLPTLAQLLQHSDPQVLHSICECWRRVIDGCITAHERPKEDPGTLGRSIAMRLFYFSRSTVPGSLVSRFAAEARLRLGAEKRPEEEDEDEDEDDDDEPRIPAMPAPPVSETPAVTTEKLSASLKEGDHGTHTHILI
eukprot:g3639.t1